MRRETRTGPGATATASTLPTWPATHPGPPSATANACARPSPTLTTTSWTPRTFARRLPSPPETL